MSNPAAVIALTYDVVDIQEDPIGTFLQLIRGLAEGPSVRGADIIVPGRVGRIEAGRIGDTWRLELAGLVAGVGAAEVEQRADFATRRAALRALFDPARGAADLAATLEDGTLWTIRARPLPGPLWDQIVPSMARVSYELEALGDWVAVPS